MSRILPRVATACLFLAALTLSPSCEQEGREEVHPRFGRAPSAEERSWIQDTLRGRWAVKFASGATAVWELTVKEVRFPRGSFCHPDGYSRVRWLSSAYACSEYIDPYGDVPSFVAVTEGTAASTEKLLDGRLLASFFVYRNSLLPNDIHFVAHTGVDTHFQGTLEAGGTVMRGPALEGPLARLGAFEARKVPASPPPVAEPSR